MVDRKGKPRGLGRGLSALMADVGPGPTERSETAVQPADRLVPIERLVANPKQPRRRFSSEALDDLAASIKEKGILQPLIVRESAGGVYEIVAGERRWRAAQRAQLHQVPVLVREFNDTEVLEVAIIENIQRSDLNAIEEATGYRQLMEEFDHTQEKLAEVLGKSRSHIANLMRLLTLPEDVQDHLREGRLSAGHARALITSENPSEIARAIIRGGLSVRATEALVKRGTKEAEKKDSQTVRAKRAAKDADTRALEDDLSANLGMRVILSHKPGQEGGEMTIKYNSLDKLDTLCRLLSGS